MAQFVSGGERNNPCFQTSRLKTSMKQLLQNLRNGETIVAEVPVPTPQSGEALVCTAASLVSAGTERMLVDFAEKSLLGKARSRPDLVRQVLDKARREGLLTTIQATFSRLEQPMVLGYSSAGTIVALGHGLSGFRVGQRVACAGGGYAVHAEYVCVPGNLLAPLPDAVDFESAAFATLGAIALHGFRLAETQLGERLAVIGLGLLGLLAVGIARAAGCHVFGVDLDPRRVALAQGMGAEAVLRQQAVEAAQSFSRGRGCDAVLICADTPSGDPVELAGVVARDRARVVAVGAVGLNIPRKIYYEKELTFLNSRSYGPGRYDPSYEEDGRDYPIGYVRWTEGRNLEAFVDLLASGRLDVKPLITHRFPIEQAPQAYGLITGKLKEPFLGVLLTYPAGVKGIEGSEDEVRSAQPVVRGTQTVQTTLYPVAQAVESVRLGVLGAGNFATAVMLPALQNIPGLELEGIASASGMSAQHAARRFGFHYATSDEAQILNDPQINTVAILTRHNLHARQVLAALAAGKHIFCEKPLALNNEELDKIFGALKGLGDRGIEDNEQAASFSPGEAQAGIPYPLLMVGFNRRFAPLAQRLKEFLAKRKEPLAAHYRVNAGFIPLNHWAHDPVQGGGRIIGEGCHFVDFLTFLVGAAPLAVTVQALPDGGRYREDNAQLTFKFPDGSLGTISYLANGDKAFPKERVEVFCSGRVAVLDDYRTLEMVSDGRRQAYRSPLRQDKGHRAEWQAFVKALRTGGPPPIPYEQIFGVMRATFAAVEALRSGEQIRIESIGD
jgi:predicted dehydrogenase/threonine dehydrogenase-like Zn-dependent dehydrogenase